MRKVTSQAKSKPVTKPATKAPSRPALKSVPPPKVQPTKAGKAVHNVHPGLMSLLVPIDSLVIDPKNARSHDARNIKTIADSLAEHGQRKPLVVRESNRTVEAGNGGLAAMKTLGWTHCAALMCNDDEIAATKYAVRDNRTGDLSDWDVSKLADLVLDLRAAEIDFTALGFEDFEIEPILAFRRGFGDDGTTELDNIILPEQRVGLMFTRDQWDQLGTLLACKPTADEILKRLRGGK